MKKLLIVIVLIIGTCSQSKAQEIGIRFGDNIGGNVAIDGAFAFKNSRVHADVSFGRGLGVDAMYDFIFRPLGDEAFYWYLGAGASLLLGDPFVLGIPGELGIEYRFQNAPVAIGLDWRPTLIIIEDTDFEVGWFGLNVRYVIGE